MAGLDARLVDFNRIGGDGLGVEGPSLELLKPDSDQPARQVMSAGEAMKGLASLVSLRHLGLRPSRHLTAARNLDQQPRQRSRLVEEKCLCQLLR